MKWLEICVYTTDAGLDAVIFAFSNAGLDQVSIEESHARAMAFLNERVVYWDYADADKVGVDEPCVKAYVADVPESAAVLEDVKRGVAQLRAKPILATTRGRSKSWSTAWTTRIGKTTGRPIINRL